jgi:glycosyltransferase involved in cell wall biosynthesis
MPVYNNPSGLSDTLASLVEQKFNKDNYEIIIVDNNSEDNTLSLAGDYQKKFPKLIKVLIEDKIQGSYAARNRGIKIAKGKIIAFIDADMSVDKDWLWKIEKFMSVPDIEYAGCDVEIIGNDRSFHGLYNRIISFRVEERIKNNHYAPTCCLVIKKSIIDKLGLFDPRLISGGDWEFGNRAWVAGYKQYFIGNVIMKHPTRDSIKEFLRKNFRTGRGKFQLDLYYLSLRKYHRSVTLKYLFLRPGNFFKRMLKKKEIFGLNYSIITILYFIKWLKRLATFIGYYYEKNKNKNY